MLGLLPPFISLPTELWERRTKVQDSSLPWKRQRKASGGKEKTSPKQHPATGDSWAQPDWEHGPSERWIGPGAVSCPVVKRGPGWGTPPPHQTETRGGAKSCQLSLPHQWPSPPWMLGWRLGSYQPNRKCSHRSVCLSAPSTPEKSEDYFPRVTCVHQVLRNSQNCKDKARSMPHRLSRPHPGRPPLSALS